MTDKTQEAAEIIVLEEGRLINHSLFTRDQFNAQAEAYYKVEVAFDEDVLNDFHNKCLDAAVATWGEGADDDAALVVPIIDGNKLAKKRKANDKPGEAYEGKEVLRAKTKYNSDGEDGPGGVAVYAPDNSEIGPANQSLIYQGCYGKVAITVSTYVDNDGNHAVTAYLVAFQKTRDGERLVTPRDHSKLFKAVGRAPATEGEVAPARSHRKG